MGWPSWCVRQTNLYIYSSHFLASWGDSMWMFGSGLLLIEVLPDSLQLTAVYGLSVGLTVLLLGAVVGDWVDKTPRLRAVQISLILQKSFIILSVATVYGYMLYRDSLELSMEDWKRHLCYGFIIVFAVLGHLAQIARVITIERDWIVEMCAGDKDLLAHMTATMRRIDLGTMIISPIVTGQIMTNLGLKVGSLFIAGWNAGSLFLGYLLMYKVYKTIPALRKNKILAKKPSSEDLYKDEHLPPKSEEITPKISIEYKGKVVRKDDYTSLLKESNSHEKDKSLETKSGPSCLSKTFESITTLYRGLKTWKRYKVYRAGLSLSCLYLTVLGFDGVTVGYIYTQGVSESTLGFFMAGAGVIGVVGTIAYPIIRRRIGIIRTGMYALAAQWVFIALCVLSMFMPGSRFDPFYWSRSHQSANVSSCNNVTLGEFSATGDITENEYGSVGYSIQNSSAFTSPCLESEKLPGSLISISVFMTGIIGARFGVWIADLTITQLFLETVKETERGVVNGVQTSINMLMDMLKFALVVALPKPPVFGFLAIVSFCSVTTGDILYITYLRKVRGHLLPCHKVDKCVEKDDDKIREIEDDISDS